MYLDVVGKVTVGVGNMSPNADSAAELAFVHADSNERAPESLIREQFAKVAEQEEGHSASHYAQYTTIRLDDDEIDQLLDARLDAFESGLERDFDGYDSFPEAAKLGLMDMAFNLGNRGLVEKFPTFTRAARGQDWGTCAEECKRSQIQDSRNEEVKELFLSCTGD